MRYTNADAGIAASYAAGKQDEFIAPIVVDGYKGVEDGDSVIFYNFRSDRAREISRAILSPEFAEFKREGGYKKIFYVGMTQYDENFVGIHTAFSPKNIENTLGEYLSKIGKTQARIAETEKYAHVTFFFNGGVEEPNKGEQRVLVPSPKVATYDLQPEMSAREVTEKALGVIGTVDVVILNFANCDMVGHTGIFDAAKKAVETVDACVGKVSQAVLAQGGVLLLTADHGNADKMLDADAAVFTAHSTNPVPFLVAGYTCNVRQGGKLSDIAPTILKLMELPIPAEMTGNPLI
jgi:2,3-bisphosphoglycerate-independent phosphoglycerate mutase